MKMRLTKTEIDRLPKPAKGRRLTVYDTHQDAPTGFGLRKAHSGRVAFFLEYGPPNGRQRFTIGAYGDWTLDDARERAHHLKDEVNMGVDPVEQRRRQRAVPTWRQWVATGWSTKVRSDATPEHPDSEPPPGETDPDPDSAKTKRDWHPSYLERVSMRKKSPRQDRYFLAGNDGGRGKDAKPKDSETMTRWGSRRLDKVTAADVEALMGWYQEKAAAAPRGGNGHTTANRWLASVRACFGAAVREGLITGNPADGVKPYRENDPRQRVLTDDELAKLRKAVTKLEDPEERVLMTVLMDTGCRVSEALRMRWADLDLPTAVWTIPSPKAGRPQAMPLPLTAVNAIKGLGRRSEWVFPGVDPANPRTTIRGLWTRLKVAAKLPPTLKTHDLRRTFGLRVGRHAGILAASRLLRHSDTRVTSRVYVPLGVEELRSVVDEVSKPGNVVELKKAKRQ